MTKHVEGEFLGHVGCPKHGGSDSLGLYRKPDGKIDGHCWSECGYIGNRELQELGVIDKDNNVLEDFVTKSGGVFVMTEDVMEKVEKVKQHPIIGWKERNLPTIVNEFYGVRTKKNDDGDVVYRYYPSTEDGEIVGYHVRDVEAKKKRNSGDKDTRPPFFPIGKVKSGCELFGQSLYTKGGKYVAIAAGEEDVLAIALALNYEKNGGKWERKKFENAVVSTTTGESSIAQIRNNYEWINSFQNIIVMYDNDTAGKEGAEKVAKVFPPNKVKIAKFKRKDACEHLQHNELRDIVQAFWNAESHCPAGVIGSSSTYEALLERASFEKVSLPAFAKDLQDMFNGGLALGEITTLAAASSIGKTSIVNEFVYHWIFNTPYKVGIISLESDVGELTENLMSLHMSKRLTNMPDEDKLEYYRTDEFRNAYKDLTITEDNQERYYILDHRGAVTDGSLFNKIEYMVKVLDCKIVLLDPLSLALSGEGNEGIDHFMSELLRFVKREKVCFINVAHIRKNSGDSKANSRGAEISEEMIKGSGSIFQVSMNNILLMRDKVNDDPIIRNTTKVVVSKNRRVGNTGSGGYWYFNHNTSRLIKGINPEDLDPNNESYVSDILELQSIGAFQKEDAKDDFDEIESISDEWEEINS